MAFLYEALCRSSDLCAVISSIVQPYPETHWCEVPPEDLTNKKLCRPLPVEKKAPPPKVEPRPGNMNFPHSIFSHILLVLCSCWVFAVGRYYIV